MENKARPAWKLLTPLLLNRCCSDTLLLLQPVTPCCCCWIAAPAAAAVLLDPNAAQSAGKACWHARCVLVESTSFRRDMV